MKNTQLPNKAHFNTSTHTVSGAYLQIDSGKHCFRSEGTNIPIFCTNL